MKALLNIIAILLCLDAAAQEDRATKIFNENAAADERRLQKLKDDGRKPNTPSNNGSGVSKEYWMEQQAAGEKAREDYNAAAARVRAGYATDTRPVYERREHIAGRPEDYVEITYANGALYWGGWRKYKYHGKGKLINSNGDIYDGDWVNDKREGIGTLYTVYDHSWYEGEFKNNEPDGQGRLKTAHSLYEGQFKKGEEDGAGIRTDDEGNVKDGTWKKGFFKEGRIKMMQYGKLKFDCHFTGGDMNGDCMEVLPDGSILTATYKMSVMVGNGKKVWPNGDVYEGEFKEGLYHGKGELTLANGTIQEGTWLKGVFVK